LNQDLNSIQIFGSRSKFNPNIWIKFKIHNPYFIKEIKLNFKKLVSLGPTRYNLARGVNLTQSTRLDPDPRGIGTKKPTGQKSPSLKKLTRPKTTQKPCGLRLVHGLSS